ncbi:hypothetical protein P8452_53964 [Trifolium repens]|nr:hypothetical protein P8452_53964 [Trifolium repens]
MTGKESDTDRLSDLPDQLLLHILQFMMTKHSAQTCILSKRWQNLWKSLTNIKLYHLDRYNNGVIFDKFVSQFLSGRDNNILLHSISYVNGCITYPFSYETNIPVKIMEYAASHDVQELKINCQSDHLSNLIELPPSIFNCTSLTSLTLCLWDRSKPNIKMFPKSLNLPALKTLKLSCFTFFPSDDGYAEPFSTCNMLSKLAIFACSLQDDAQGLCISNSKLSNLAIGTLSPSNIRQVILCTPKLTSLTINGNPPTFPAPYTYNLTLLEELRFDCWCGKLSTMRENIMISWLRLLAKVKIMTLSTLILESMVNALKNNGSMRVQLPSFVKLKSLKVELPQSLKICDNDEIVREMVTYLLQNSPPPATFIISKEVDQTCDDCMFIGFFI